jgi:microcystin-dependent protein
MNSLKAAFTDLQNGTVATGPIGSVIMWAGPGLLPADIPAGYAVANGAYLSTVTYATLYGIIGTRYGATVGVTFPLPNFTSNVPEGITGTPTAPFTKTTSATAIDAHTHTVNGTINASGQPNAVLGLGINAGNADTHSHSGANLSAGTANTHTHAGSVLTQGNVDAHLHGIGGNTGDESAQHVHTNSGQSNSHGHSYFRPNTGANSNTGLANSDHTHTVNSNTGNHSHAFLLNSANATATLNTSITAPGAPNVGLGMSVNNVGAPNAGLALAFVNGNANTHTHAAANLTAGTATTINDSPLPTHTHTTATTQIIFIIRVL